MKRCCILAAMAMGLLSGAQAFGDMYGFRQITFNDPRDNGIGEAQLSLAVTQSGSQVLFTFANSGPQNCAIAAIYFDDNAGLLKSFSIIDSPPEVSFTNEAKPNDLPGGSSYNFISDFGASPKNQASQKGVNPGESLGILFNLNSGDLEDVLAAMNNGSLRIGMHVQSFPSGLSESFINSVVPAPAALSLGLLGLMSIPWVKRRLG